MKKHFTTPRLIGIILLVIAALTYYIGQRGTTGLAIAGIILLIAPTKHAKDMLDLFIKTITNWKTIIITALYEAFYWLFAYGAVYFLKWRVETKLAIAQGQASFSKEAIMQSAQAASQTAASLENFVAFTFTMAALTFIFAFIIYTLSRSLIWTTITNQKTSKKFLLRFTGLNALWWLIWTPLFALTIIGAQRDPTSIRQVIAILLPLAYHFTPIVHTLYMKKQKTGYSLSNGIAWGISKIHKFIIPYTYIFIAYVILYQLYRLAENTAWIQPASILFVVIFIAWARTYVYEIVKEFK